MAKKITTAVFPVAGLGTRFLPVTKSAPKEMLPIVDKPLIQYVVEEAVAAGINQLILVTSYSKHAVEDYFDTNFELETRLKEKGKEDLLDVVHNIVPKGVSIVYVRQHAPLGLGHAVLCAKKVVGDEPFAVLLADDIIDCDGPYCLEQMVSFYEETGASVLAVEEVPTTETDKYGIVSLAENPEVPTQIKAIVEKPAPKDAPSNLAVIGRYILTPRIFALLEATESGVGGEIQLTDAIAKLLKEQPVTAFQFSGTRYDCGSKVGFLEATIAYAMKRPELREALKKILNEKCCDGV
ncbi:MAG: UTP--glucose-1-phosphate uridylyltransferase [Coxiella sp. (in: Bacteria)]|nr:MAG: UTP--glucose-1-phosphate uridylyltransferase [Coxiella sp. (in: g-proteobacteria)]